MPVDYDTMTPDQKVRLLETKVEGLQKLLHFACTYFDWRKYPPRAGTTVQDLFEWWNGDRSWEERTDQSIRAAALKKLTAEDRRVLGV